MLKVSADIRAHSSTGDHAMIGVYLNGSLLGVLPVEAEHADQLVGLLNGATDMWELVQELAEAKGWHGTGSPDCMCLPCRARKIVAKSEGGQT